jgi:hypothetical protein
MKSQKPILNLKNKKMKNSIFITDIFGNSIEVTDLKGAISQTKQFAHMSKQNNIIFTEFYFENRMIHMESNLKRSKRLKIQKKYIL